MNGARGSQGAEARSVKFIMLRAWACPLVLRSHVMAAGAGGKAGDGSRVHAPGQCLMLNKSGMILFSARGEVGHVRR